MSLDCGRAIAIVAHECQSDDIYAASNVIRPVAKIVQRSLSHMAGPPATAAYSTEPQFLQPTIRARIIEYRRYAKVE